LEKAKNTLSDSKKYINDVTLESTVNRIYSDMFKIRQKAIIKDFVKFEKQDVEEWLKKADEFINIIDNLTLSILQEQ